MNNAHGYFHSTVSLNNGMIFYEDYSHVRSSKHSLVTTVGVKLTHITCKCLLLVDYLIPKNFKFCREVPNSGYRGFLGWRIGILMEASSPRGGMTSK